MKTHETHLASLAHLPHGGDSNSTAAPKVRTLVLFLFVSVLVAGVGTAQAPATDIWLLEREQLGTDDVAPLKVTDRDEYDNQPQFLPDGRLVFTAASDDGTTNIEVYDPSSRTQSTLFDFAESLYSPTPIPASNANRADEISVIRDYGNQKQQLWALPLDGSDPRVLVDDINPIGYHAWRDRNRLLLWVLPQQPDGSDSPTLRTFDLASRDSSILGTSPGRALARTPHGHWPSGTTSFALPAAEQSDGQKRDGPTPLLLQAVGADGEVAEIVQLLEGGQDYAWRKDGTLWMAKGSKLFRWIPEGEWTEILDVEQWSSGSEGSGSISRMAWSPDGERLAIVVQR